MSDLGDIPPEADPQKTIRLVSGAEVPAEPGWVIEGDGDPMHIRASASDLVEVTETALVFELRETGTRISLQHGKVTAITRGDDGRLMTREMR